jgi:hypothetical protein
MPILGSSASQSGRIPDTATITGVTAGNGQATITFTEPTYKGKGTVTYTVTSSPSGITASGASSPIVITGLANGTSYTFTVATVSVNGVSTSSSASSSVTPITPTAGFVAGGLASNGSSRLATISKVTFSNDSISTLGAGLSEARYTLTAHSNSGTAGYICGGYGSNHTSIINKLTYSADSVSTLSPGLSAVSSESAGFANSGSHGYVVGGINQSFNNWGNRIERTSYSDDTTSGINMSSGSFGRELSGASNNGVAGYAFGGFENPSGSNTIMKFNFSNNTAASIAATISSSVGKSSASANSGTAAYIGGGYNFSGVRNTIDKLAFSNDTRSILGNTLSTNRARSSGFANSGTASYFASGDANLGSGGTTTVDKVVFSNDTRSSLGTNISYQANSAGFANSGVL